MSLTVKNTQRVAFVLNLLPSTKVEKDSPYAGTTFSMETALEAKAGHGPGTRLVEKALPGSITWLPGETKTDLPEGLTEIAEFQRARVTRKLVLVEGDPKTAAAQPAPSSALSSAPSPSNVKTDAGAAPSGEHA